MKNGCDYKIPEASVQGSSYTGGALPSFTAPSTAGTVPYTIVLENDVGPTPKTCNVKFIEAGSGGIKMTNNDQNISVPCNKSIEVTNTNISGCNAVISCSGAFDKTVGDQSTDQYNSSNYVVGKKTNAIVPTSCASGNTMKCNFYCW